MCDGSTYYNNETVCLVSKGLQVSHQVTRSFPPESNRAVEYLDKKLLCIFKSISFEPEMRLDESNDLLLLVKRVFS